MNVHLFEFNDHPAVPAFLRKTLFEVLTYCNGRFRPYYQQVAADVLAHAESRGTQNIVELGAGLAPITQELLKVPGNPSLTYIPCDLFPVPDAWKRLEESSSRVKPVYQPVDFSKGMDWAPKTTLLLVAALHHIPHSARAQILRNLIQSADSVLIYEPISNSPSSIALSSLAWIPSWITPAVTLRNPGWFRRIVWCWLIPIIPILFTWDGLVGCFRQWTVKQWEEFESELGEDVATEKSFTHHGYRISFHRTSS